MIKLAGLFIFFALFVLFFGVVLLDMSQKKNNTNNNDGRSQDEKYRSDDTTFLQPHCQKRKDGKISFYGNTRRFDDDKVTYNNSSVKYLYGDYGEFKGAMGEKKAATVLWKLSFDDWSHIMNNVKLPLYDKTCEIDHLVIGKFGVLVIETKSQSGYIYGRTDDKNLTQEIGQYTYTFYNPLFQNKTHTDNVSYHLRKGGFRNVPVYGIVVFTSEDVIFPDGLGIRLSELTDYYKNLRYVGCDKEKVYEYLKSISVDYSAIL